MSLTKADNKLSFNQRLNYTYRMFSGNKFSVFDQNIIKVKSKCTYKRISNQEQIQNFPLLSSSETHEKLWHDLFISLKLHDYGVFDFLIIGLALRLTNLIIKVIIIFLNELLHAFMRNFVEVDSLPAEKLLSVLTYIPHLLLVNAFACIGTAALLPVLALSEVTGLSDYIEPQLPEIISMNP